MVCFLRELIKLIPCTGHTSSVFWRSFVVITDSRRNTCAIAQCAGYGLGGCCRQRGALSPVVQASFVGVMSACSHEPSQEGQLDYSPTSAELHNSSLRQNLHVSNPFYLEKKTYNQLSKDSYAALVKIILRLLLLLYQSLVLFLRLLHVCSLGLIFKLLAELSFYPWPQLFSQSNNWDVNS